MSDFIYSKITVFGQSIEIMTPKHRPDAQHEHTLAYFAAYNELRAREADRRAADGTYSEEYNIAPLRKPVKIYSRVNPSGLRQSPGWGTSTPWRPALPVDWWHAPKPASDRQARKNADMVKTKIASGTYVPRSDWSTPGAQRTPREAFTELTFEEV